MQKLEEPATVTVDLKEHAHGNIVTLWKERKHTDVTFLVGEGRRRVCAHRVILACQSSYFETLLFGEMVEATKEEIPLPDISDPDLFVSIVEYAYTGKIEIKDKRIQDVLDAMALADRFSFTKLKDALSEELASMVTLDNVLTLLVCGDLYHANAILNKCLGLIDKDAKKILEHEEFLTLTPSTLRLIISRDTFLAPEMSIYQAVFRWKSQNSVSKEDLADILGCIRLSEISARELFTTIEPSRMFEPSEITTALRIQIKPEIQNMKPRGRKELGKNLFELSTFANSGGVEYQPLGGGGLGLSPPKITEGVIDLYPPNGPTFSETIAPSQVQVNQRHGGMVRDRHRGGSNQAGTGLFNQAVSGLQLGSSNQVGGGFQLGGGLFTNAQVVGLGSGYQGGGGLGGYGLQPPRRGPSTKVVELNDLYLITTITVSAFPSFDSSPPLNRWQFSYKIKISKYKETWVTLFDFSEVDCYFIQTLRFPVQAVRYIEFELVSSGQPMKLKFVNCSFEETRPLKFLDTGITGPLKLSPVGWFLFPDLPPCDHKYPQTNLKAIALNTPVLMGQLSFLVVSSHNIVSADISVSISRKWDYSSFKEVGKVIGHKITNEVCLDFEEEITSYVLVSLDNITRGPSSDEPNQTVETISIQNFQCRVK